MKLRISGLIQIIKRELEIISKDFDLIMMLLIAPVFYSLLYGSFYIYKSENEVPVAVLDMDRTIVSQKFISDLDANQLIKVTDKIFDFDEAKDLLFKDKVQGVIIIPEDFESHIKSNKGTEIKLYLNTQRFLPSNDINKSVNEVVLEYNKRARLRAFEMKGINPKQVEEIVEPLRDNVKYLFNSSVAYGDFLIPAILILVLQQTLFIGLGESIAKEREFGTILNWYSTANYSTAAALTGKGMLYLIIYFCYAIFFFVIDFSIFKINFAGSYLLLFAATILFLVAMISLSIFVASFFKRKILALQVISFTSYPIFFLTGYAWPDFAMPKSLYFISQLLPSTPFFDIYSRITFMGANYSEIKGALVHILILTMVGLTLSFYRMRKLFIPK